MHRQSQKTSQITKNPHSFDTIQSVLRKKAHELQLKTGMSDEDMQAMRQQVREEDEALAIEAQAVQSRLRQAQIFNNSLINDKLKSKTFDNYIDDTEQQKRAKRIAERYADNFSYEKPSKLIMLGKYGTGKSHLAASAFKKIMTKQTVGKDGYIRTPTALFVTVPKLITVLTDGYQDGSRSKKIRELSEVDLLVLDDFGREKEDNERGSIVSDLFDIIDGREGKHTIVTSNLTVSELMGRYGEAPISRLVSKEDAYVMQFDWDNYRLAGLI